ncbi:hypothetical protein [Alienimonas sp. DA493]|uniref:hypothetical protein n=1 Tax=Alienimonas sp. DA493 TaxID=3373605 RepID=UPI003754BBF7
MQPRTPRPCPDPLREAFLELLRCTLILIRNGPDDAAWCQALADHLHNVPTLLIDFDPDLLRYYWEVERACFLDALGRIDRPPPAYFDEPWRVVERSYRRLPPPPTK